MFILQDFFFVSSAFLSKSSGDCIYESREARQDAQPRYFENREAPGNKVGEKERRDWQIDWELDWEEGGREVLWLENYKQQQQRLFCSV